MANRKKADAKKKVESHVEQIKTRATDRAAKFKSKTSGRIAKIKAIKSGTSNNTVTDNRLELLITTVNRGKGEFFIDLLQSFDVNMQFVALGNGTADATILSKFGFTDSEKTVIFSVIQQNKLPAALEALDEKFRTIKNGKGVAYTVPLSSVIGTLLFGFLSNNKMAVKEDSGK